MQLDFHYYATYCAAFLAGYKHAQSLEIAYAAQYVDCCTRTALKKMKAPLSAATTQTQMELMDANPGILALQDFTRIWASFHFLPRDLYSDPGRRSRAYLSKYRLICGPNGALLLDTLRLARRSGSPQAIGIAMHILADTWAHQHFAGTPSLVINNTTSDFYEILEADGEVSERKISFQHRVGSPDDFELSRYTNSLLQTNEYSVMNLGHGRAGHLPDYCFIKYRYLPAWGDFEEIVKDNPSDYLFAFAQMVYALRLMRTGEGEFEAGRYDFEALEPIREELEVLLHRRQPDACKEWKAIGERLSGQTIPEFTSKLYEYQYLDAAPGMKDGTAPGRFFIAAMAHKSMVTKRIFDSGNLIAGYSVDYFKEGFKGIKDFRKLVENMKGRVSK